MIKMKLTELLTEAVAKARELYKKNKDGLDRDFQSTIEEIYNHAMGEARYQAGGTMSIYEEGGYFELDYLVSKLKEHDPKTDRRGWYDNNGEKGLILKIESREDIKEVWRNFAKYVKPLEKAKRLSEEYPFLNWDEEEERRVINKGKINVYNRILENIPELEKKGLYKELCVLREIVSLIETGKI